MKQSRYSLEGRVGTPSRGVGVTSLFNKRRRLVRKGLFVLLAFVLCLLPVLSTGMEAKESPTPAAATQAALPKAEIDAILKAHNDARKAAAATMPPLKWSTAMANLAQSWATYLASKCTLEHRTPRKYGENLSYSSGGVQPRPGAAAVARWLSEKAYYNYATNKCSSTMPGCLHYTQIVWRATTSVGCGKGTCGQATIWVCNYDPMGNVNIATTKPY